MGDGGLNAQLGGDVDEAAANADGDLGADYGVDGGGFGAVSDEEADTKEVDAGAGGDVVLVVVGVFDDEADDDGADSGGEGESLGDVARGGDGLMVHDLKVRVEVGLD